MFGKPEDDERLRKFQDELMRKLMNPDPNPAPPVYKPFKDPLDKFLSGQWLDYTSYVMMGQPVKPPWVRTLNSLMDSHIFDKDAVERGIKNWLAQELNNTISLPSNSPTKNLITALRLLVDGKDDQLESDHIKALENGKQIFEDLAKARATHAFGMHPTPPSVLTQCKKGSKKPIIENMGKIAGEAYADILLPSIKQYLNSRATKTNVGIGYVG